MIIWWLIDDLLWLILINSRFIPIYHDSASGVGGAGWAADCVCWRGDGGCKTASATATSYSLMGLHTSLQSERSVASELQSRRTGDLRARFQSLNFKFEFWSSENAKVIESNKVWLTDDYLMINGRFTMINHDKFMI